MYLPSNSDCGFLKRIAAALQESQLDSRYLKLELTESVLMQHAASTVSVLEAVKRMGVTIAVDDFGTGYAAMFIYANFRLTSLKSISLSSRKSRAIVVAARL